VEGIASGGAVNINLIAGGIPSEDDYIELYVWASGAVNITR